MSTYTFLLPDIGEGVAEAEIDEWYVQVGQAVAEDDVIVSVLTDKATMELTSPVDGTITSLGPEAGSRVAVGSALVTFDLTGDGPPADPPRDKMSGSTDSIEQPPPASTESSEPAPTDDPASNATTVSPHPRIAPETRVEADTSTAAPRRVLASPSVRRRAAEAGIDLRLVHPSDEGRVTHADLDDHARGAPVVPGRRVRTSVDEVPVRGVRRAIANAMTRSATRIPHITLVEQVDVTRLEEVRRALNAEEVLGRPRLTPLAFIVQAITRAVADHPTVNARYDDEAEVVHRHAGVHVGIATQTPDGLKVPVLRHAEALPLFSIAAAVAELSQAARDGSLPRGEMTGSTITVSSLGAVGGVMNTPIINHPEVAIVGVNAKQVQPRWDGTQFVPRDVIHLSSSFDHRVVDGWDAAMFLQRLKGLLEEPSLAMVEG